MCSVYTRCIALKYLSHKENYLKYINPEIWVAQDPGSYTKSWVSVMIPES